MHLSIGVRDQLRLGGVWGLLSEYHLWHARALENSLSGGGGGGFVHLFWPCAKKVPLWTHVSHILCNTCSKCLESKKKKKKLVARKSSGLSWILLVTCPKIKCFSPNIICFFTQIWPLEKSWGGGGSPPPHLVRPSTVVTFINTSFEKQTENWLPMCISCILFKFWDFFPQRSKSLWICGNIQGDFINRPSGI